MAEAAANASEVPFKTHIVSSTASPEFNLLLATLRSSRLAALDAEWKPRRHCSVSPASAEPGFSKPFPTVALLQIAFSGADAGQGEPTSRSLVFLVDLLAVPLQELHGPLKELFESPQVLKLGFRFKQDLDYLNATFAAALKCKDFAFDKVEPFEDISNIYSCIEHLSVDMAPSRQTKSLATICKELLNISMSKELQCSDWSFRPLSEEQITYAAADAYYLLEIFAIFQERIGNDADELTSSGGNYLQKSKLAASMANFSKKIVPTKLEKQPVSSKRKPRLSKEKMHFNSEWKGPAPWDPLVGGDGCPKFLCDVMIEGLAKHLRCVGFDAATPQSKKPDPRELIDQAQKEKRVLLTRDAKLLKYEYLLSNQVYIVKSLLKADQLLEVIETFQLKITEDQLMSRCTKCNGSFIQKPLTIEEAVEASKGFQIIPRCLFDKNLEFWKCINCGQLYWEGTQYHHAVQKFISVCNINK